MRTGLSHTCRRNLCRRWWIMWELTNMMGCHHCTNLTMFTLSSHSHTSVFPTRADPQRSVYAALEGEEEGVGEVVELEGEVEEGEVEGEVEVVRAAEVEGGVIEIEEEGEVEAEVASNGEESLRQETIEIIEEEEQEQLGISSF